MFVQYEFDEYPGARQLPMVQEPVFSTGQVVGMIVFSFLAAGLFAWWGKSRAEDHDVHPLIGMLLGFTLGWIGLKIIPLFKSGQVVRQKRRTNIPPPAGGNPIYGHGTSFQPPAQPLQHNPQAQQPVPMQQAYPQPPSHTQAAPPPSEPPSMLVADENGYVECPICQARSKSNRKSCMSCGTQFPDIYDPSYKPAKKS